MKTLEFGLLNNFIVYFFYPSGLGAAIASAPESMETVAESPKAPSHRQALPSHLPRQERLINVCGDACPDCGGELHSIGETVSEMLDWIPAQVQVLRIRRPKMGCRRCETVHQAVAPARPIAGGLPTSAMLAQILTSKYCDHTPLYRQSQIFARHGVEIERSTLAGSAGRQRTNDARCVAPNRRRSCEISNCGSIGS
jgi:transposase